MKAESSRIAMKEPEILLKCLLSNLLTQFFKVAWNVAFELQIFSKSAYYNKCTFSLV